MNFPMIELLRNYRLFRHPRGIGRLCALALVALCALLGAARVALAVDIEGVQNGSIDAPKVVAVIQRPGAEGPIEVEGDVAAIPAFLDTGSSGMIIRPSFADALGVDELPGVTFSDVGLGGTVDFDVSEELIVRVAPNPFAEPTEVSSYNHNVGPLRTQIGPPGPQDPLLSDTNIFGMPAMVNKVTVIDPKPLNLLLTSGFLEGDFISTYIYDPGTPFNPGTADTDPGIPTTSHHVQLSYGDFERFTETTPPGSPTVQLEHNPFIGPNPVAQLEDDVPPGPPPVVIGFNGLQTSGSFLLDTGAQASFISSILAEQLNVRQVPSTIGLGDPVLEVFDPLNPELPGVEIESQFDLLIGGIGGITTVPGFFLDFMTLPTIEGSAAADDPNNIRYIGAPVLVADIGLEDPDTGDFLVLDGIFGMNFLVASQFIDGFELGSAALGPFNWVTFDEPNGILGLDLIQPVPEPGSLVLSALGAAMLIAIGLRRKYRRR